MMQQTQFSRINTLLAWLLFGIASVVYGLTVEPTASLWDCPEFIACGYKLEVGHPPGAPIFMLAANLFSQLASSPADVAFWVNILSALLSAGCIFFLYLTVTHFARQLVCPVGAMTTAQTIAILASGVVGALAYTFSDTFWFSAVEGEVYAFSSFLTALTFWLILKWESQADLPGSDRWIVLIAYVVGLSIGVHILNLLCLPAMALVVYFRRSARPTVGGSLKAIVVGGLLIGVVLFGIIRGVPMVGGWFELLFTNHLGLPYNTGLAVYLVVLAALLFWGLRVASGRRVALLLRCFVVTLIGFSSYAVIMIRANANTPMSENAPGNIFSLGSYLSRKQYGDTPLLYGPSYGCKPEQEVRGDYIVPRQTQGAAVYRPTARPGKDKYDLLYHEFHYHWRDNMLLPRMHSARHAQAYESWMNGVEKVGDRPTMAENLRFLLTYQVGFMYWRYFLWNFVGRQNNIQGHGEPEHGNWLTGFGWIDDLLLGCDTSKLPSDLRNNKGRNVFYGLPLLVGLLGMCWQWRRRRSQWVVVAMLFFMTGLAIVAYLNQTPLQPRERDYAYAGSFYAFAVWIGLGVAGLWSWAVRRLPKASPTAMAAIVATVVMAVPLQMASQTWDDHDRSGRTTCRDFGLNYLESTQREGCPILLTDGDNDTFPLWYNQEVEGRRTDVRVCNLEYLQTDWYIDQMRRPAYDSPPLPISWSHDDYQEGRNEYVPIDHDDFPNDSLTLGTGDAATTLSLAGVQGLGKNDLMVLNMLENARWQRPVYLSISLGPSLLSYLSDHLVVEGLACRVVPDGGGMRVDVERLYDNVMHRFRYGNLNKPGIYVDDDVLYMANTHQNVLSLLIDSLLQRGDLQRAVAVSRKWQEELPPANVPYTDAALSMARCYYRANQPRQADAIVDSLLSRSAEWLEWIDTVKPSRSQGSRPSAARWLRTMRLALSVATENNRTSIMNRYLKAYETYLKTHTDQP